MTGNSNPGHSSGDAENGDVNGGHVSLPTSSTEESPHSTPPSGASIATTTFQFRQSSVNLLQQVRQESVDQPVTAKPNKPSIHMKLRREGSAIGKELLQKSHSDPSRCTRPFARPQKPLVLHRRRGSPVSKCILTLDGYSYVIGESLAHRLDGYHW